MLQPPIATGTLLQNRYRLLSILGQGGFGRTYLVEDTNRFNERCALKELISAQTSPYAIQKSQELFQREAQILYQIQHPQIPQFRATFEENGRLFLLQDYVAGKSYRTLLNERKITTTNFSEAEVLHLLKQLLPVLEYIHNRGIIHRDISPDNIICRDGDGWPVLIDFGVVKEIATRVLSTDTEVTATTVGKMGYSPSEQIQTGRAYPSSDLYALAVTAIVLLTGKEPQELFDDVALTWKWQDSAKTDPRFAAILNKMLNYRPGERYLTAREVSTAIDALSIPPTPAPVPQNPPASTVKTIAIGNRQTPPQNYLNNSPSNSPQNAEAEFSFSDNPVLVSAVAVVTMIFVGVGVLGMLHSVGNRKEEQPPVASSAPPTTQPTAPSTIKPPPKPLTPQVLKVELGKTKTVKVNFKDQETLSYLISGQPGDSLRISGDGVLISVLTPDGKPVSGSSSDVPVWDGVLNRASDYTIKLKPFPGLQQSEYKVNVTLSAPAPAFPTEPPLIPAPPIDIPPETIPPANNPPETIPPANNPPETIPPTNNPPANNPPETIPPANNPPETIPPTNNSPEKKQPTDNPQTLPPSNNPPDKTPPAEPSPQPPAEPSPQPPAEPSPQPPAEPSPQPQQTPTTPNEPTSPIPTPNQTQP